MYGDIPCLPVDFSEEEGERFVGEEADSWLLLEDFVPAIDAICENFLDYGDVDFFDKEKCLIIRAWLRKRKEIQIPERLEVLYSQLENFLEKAIELDTGVVIEL